MAANPLVVIVGETASGKSALALHIADQFNGEIICADSRTVYKGMDIGTAKPLKEEQERISHHLLDIIAPDERFNVATFQKLCFEIIEELEQKKKLPILVGGTGLYIDSVIFNYAFTRDNTEKDEQNPRHLKKTAEAYTEAILRANTLVIGLHVDSEVLKSRITKRVDTMVEQGLMEEIKTLAERYSWDAPGLLAPGYKAFRGYIEGTISLDEAKKQFVLNDIHLAKRQRTWFKRNKYIQWVSTPEDAYALVEQFLAKQADH